MWDDLAKFISILCDKKSKEREIEEKIKVVELAVGRFQGVSNYLKEKENVELIMTDISPANEKIMKDDLFNPNMEIYKDTDILFSIRPPFELQNAILNIQKKLDCTLIIKPLFNEDLNIKNKNMKMKNYGKASFYIMNE